MLEYQKLLINAEKSKKTLCILVLSYLAYVNLF